MVAIISSDRADAGTMINIHGSRRIQPSRIAQAAGNIAHRRHGWLRLFSLSCLGLSRFVSLYTTGAALFCASLQQATYCSKHRPRFSAAGSTTTSTSTSTHKVASCFGQNQRNQRAAKICTTRCSMQPLMLWVWVWDWGSKGG